MCKKATGGPFAVLVQASLEAFRWTKGLPRSYRSSPISTSGFCDLCGTTLYLHYDDDELTRVTAGSLDYPERARPTGHYGVESRLGGRGFPEEKTQETF
ncbi:GFA family protein [Rhizobium leguminosarum]|nr:GFA family protein [Rhizobium leguminosarum]